MGERRRQTLSLLGVTIGHGAHDAWFGVAPILLASLSLTLGLSNSEIGLMLLLYQSLSSVTQPYFGRLSERVGGRALAVGAILWTTALYSGALFVESKVALAVLLALAGLGSGAWHPHAVAAATVSGGEEWGATAASVFFLGGTAGSAFLGAALGGYLLEAHGAQSLLLISAISIVLALTVVRRLVPDRLPAAKKREDAGATRTQGNGWTAGVLALLGFLLLATALRSLTFHTLNTYVPKYQQDMGVTPATYGLVMSMFHFGAAIGGVAGGYLADRTSIRAVLAGSMLLAAALLWGFVRSAGLPSYLLLMLAGLLVGPSHTLLVVAGQRRFPRRMAMISGVFLGFTFVSGAGGAWVLGLLADRVGLPRVLSWLPWALVGAVAASLVALPRRAPATAASSEGRRLGLSQK